MSSDLDPGTRPTGIGPLREALGSLTFRGRGFVIGGVAAVTCGLLVGERDVVRLGVLSVLLPLAAAVWLARTGHELRLVRAVGHPRIAVGQSTNVRVELTDLGRPTARLLVEEQLPWALGDRPHFVVESMRTDQVHTVDYEITAEQRGRYAIGPAVVRASDPTGMVEIRRVFDRAAELVVVPAAEPLPAINLGGVWTGNGDNRPRPFTGGSAADVAVREYRQGDEVRRVHWPSSARTGTLMVRTEEQPWQSRCTLLVDNRAIAHRGQGADSSLERAVTVAASVAVHLTQRGYQVRLVSAAGDAGEVAWHDTTPPSPEPILDRLAVLPASGAVHLHDAWVDETVTGGLLIAVLGALDDHDIGMLARIRLHGGTTLAVALDTPSWTGPRQTASDGAQRLRRHGWKAASLARGGSVATTWQELGR
jgi:uncharacterized protein (DUF58 family)